MKGAARAWTAFTFVLILATMLASAFLIFLEWGWYVVFAVDIVVVSSYLYVVYKRYHVELVPEGDLALFTDPEDLRILCKIYGLNSQGSQVRLRQRLLDLSRAHADDSFVWVAPGFVHSTHSTFEVRPQSKRKEARITVPELVKKMVSEAPSDRSLSKMLVGGETRSRERLYRIKICAVCDTPMSKPAPTCPSCGADLEFYAVLGESRLGKRLISEKASARRRRVKGPGGKGL